MSPDPTAIRVVVEPDKDALAESVATRFVGKMVQLTQSQGVVHVSLTGGSMGAAVLERAAAHPGAGMVDWARVHFWWSDERFLPRDDDERNALQARRALLDVLDIPRENIHEAAASGEGVSIDEAAEAYAAELARFGDEQRPWPMFDVCFLGVGPDGHIASLFPDRGEVRVTDRSVLAVRDSPKPPPERVTFTRPVINSSVRVWMVVSGPDKAPALGLVLAGASYLSVPAAGAYGTARTAIFVDEDAAAEVPEDLIDPDY